MTDARYRPREFTTEPAAFGVAKTIEWLEFNDKRRQAQRDAAQMQHKYAYRIRARVKANELTLTTFASKAGWTYERTARLLRGEVVMRLDDIAMAELVLEGVTDEGRAVLAQRVADAQAAIAQRAAAAQSAIAQRAADAQAARAAQAKLENLRRVEAKRAGVRRG